MKRSHRVACAMGAGAMFFALVPGTGHAELPPQYVRWSDFGAITRDSSIPGTLGVVDSIEWKNGRYLVRGGRCLVEVTVRREPSRAADGRPQPGPSRVSGIEVGPKRCE